MTGRFNLSDYVDVQERITRFWGEFPEGRIITEMMAKGTYAMLLLATKDLDGTFEQLQASDAEIVQEPTEQPYGVRDCAVRDPAGNLVRIQELS